MPGSASDVPAGVFAGWTGWTDWPVLPREFFAGSVTEVAQDLLGCVIEHRSADGLVAAQIVETEAYAGSADPASHSYRGKTSRNAVMFGEPGHTYVYFTYGMHFCMNLVCQPPGEACAVLLRAGRVISGSGLAARRRAAGDGLAARLGDQLASGPARLCQALGVGRELNGADVCAGDGALCVRGPGLRASPIASGPRVGIRVGTEHQWRYWISGDRAVSAYRPHVPKRRASGGK